MSFTGTYPGVYIQELPSWSHSVTAAPTSVTVFIGYTHPMKTGPDNYGQAIEVESFAEYQSYFGPFYLSNPQLPDYMGQAVYQFFNNGGSTAYIYALKPGTYVDSTGTPQLTGGQPTPFTPAAVTVSLAGSGNSVTFTALEPVSSSAPWTMQVVINNIRTVTAANDTADISILYGTTGEIHRSVNASGIASALTGSSLVTAQIAGSPTAYSPTPATYPLVYASPPQPTWTLINPADYEAAFAAGGELVACIVTISVVCTNGKYIAPLGDFGGGELSHRYAIEVFAAPAGRFGGRLVVACGGGSMIKNARLPSQNSIAADRTAFCPAFEGSDIPGRHIRLNIGTRSNDPPAAKAAS